MKWFLIFLAIGLTTSEKLDRTYLPPPGAEFAGGHPGDIQGPLELPHHPSHSPQPFGPQEIGPNGQPTQAPVTTTSYAFTQTTTYPAVEGFETTVVPINPVTGLPVNNIVQSGTITGPGYQQYNHNLPYNQIQDSGASGHNFPGLVSQGPVSDGQPINIGTSKYTQPDTPALNQYPNQNVIIPGQTIQVTGPNSQQPQQQYASDIPNSQFLNQYPGNNVVVPGGTVQLPGSGVQLPGISQGSVQYPSVQLIPGQQEYATTTAIPQGGNNLSPGRQYTTNGPQGDLSGKVPQGTYAGQPIILQETGQPQYTQGYQSQGQPILSGPQHNGVVSPGLISGQNIYQPGQNYNNVPSSTPFPSSTSAYASVGPIHRPERPQAAADRNAVILSFENVRTPYGYAYSYDTSNGIHADESGTVGDGTRAQGSYSYTGDDGKVYSVIYTADENGFQPRGDHLPTPPPIPEAIKKVIEQAARDKEAGIIHDGSYDEEKYGHKNYQGPHRKPQIQNGLINPITGITDSEYDEGGMPQDQLNNLDINGNNIGSPKKYNSNGPSNKISNTNDNNNFESEENRRVLIGDDDNVPITGINNSKNKQVHHRRPFGEITNTKQPGTQIEDNDDTYYYPDNEDGLETAFDDSNQEIENDDLGSNRVAQGSHTPENDQIKNTQPITKQKTKYGRPGFSGNKYLNEKRPQAGQVFNQGDIDDFDSVDDEILAHEGQNKIQKAPNQITKQQIDGNGYEYNTPQNEFGQTQFPSRFKGQASPILKQMPHKTYGQSTTPRPFLTPEVYNQPKGNRQGQDVNRQSGAREPFMTSRVTTPKDTSFTDYDEDQDYSTDQGIGRNGFSSTLPPSSRVNSGSRHSYKPGSQRPQISGQKKTYEITVTPTHVADTTSNTPSSRFGSAGIPRRPQHQRRPSNASNKPHSSTSVHRPTSSQTSKPEISDSYSTVRPSSSYPSTTIAPSYSTTEMQTVYNSPLPSGHRGPTLQTYPTSTYRPVSPTIGAINSEYQPVSPGTYQPTGTYQTGNQYEPSRTDYSTTRPQQPNEYYVPGTSTSSPGYYQTTTGQSPINYSGTTDKASPGRPGTFILSQPTTASRESVSIDNHSGYHYIPPANTFTHNVMSSTPTYGNHFINPNYPGPHGSHVSQTTPSGYEYGTSGPVYSTTLAPSTVGTTPGSFISTTTPRYVSPGYHTTQPSYPSTQGVYGQNPVVDGFGRPIFLEQQPGVSYPNQGAGQYPGSQIIGGEPINTTRGGVSTGPISTVSSAVVSGGPSPTYGGTQSTSYPGYYDQPTVIGEDFSGPKQTQKFDPQTGYYYK